MQSTITLVIVESSELMRLGLRTALESDERIEVLGDYAVPCQIPNGPESVVPDVALVGLHAYPPANFDAIRDLRALAPKARVLAMTEEVCDADILEAINSGTHGCIPRSSGRDDLIRSVVSVANGGLRFDMEALARMLPTGRDLESDQSLERKGLSDRQKAILDLMARGCSYEETARSLHVSLSTVKRDASILRDRLDIGSRFELAAYAERHVPRPTQPE